MTTAPRSSVPSSVPLSNHRDDAARVARTTRLARATRAATLTSACALVALCIAWEAWLAPTGRGTLAVKALPLVLALPGLWRGRLYTYRWLSLLIWLYVAEGSVRVVTEHGTVRWLAAAELLLCFALFAACAAQVRLRLAIERDKVGAPVANVPAA